MRVTAKTPDFEMAYPALSASPNVGYGWPGRDQFKMPVQEKPALPRSLRLYPADCAIRK